MGYLPKIIRNGRRTAVDHRPHPLHPDDIIAALDSIMYTLLVSLVSKNSSQAPILVFWKNHGVFLPISFLFKFKFNLDME